jgi:hypothetical protein
MATICSAAEPALPRAAGDAELTRSTVDLSGQWEFKLDPLDVGRAEKWFEAAVPFPGRIRVPGAWNSNQKMRSLIVPTLRSYLVLELP